MGKSLTNTALSMYQELLERQEKGKSLITKEIQEQLLGFILDAFREEKILKPPRLYDFCLTNWVDLDHIPQKQFGWDIWVSDEKGNPYRYGYNFIYDGDNVQELIISFEWTIDAVRLKRLAERK